MSAQSTWSPERIVCQYFIDKMKAAGFDAYYGYDRPEFARLVGKNNKPQCEIWLSNGVYALWENNEYPVEIEDVVECYVFKLKHSRTHEAGEWYDDCSRAVRSLVHSPENRVNREFLGWDATELTVDRTSPLKRWDGSLEDSAGYLVARIDLPIKINTNITSLAS